MIPKDVCDRIDYHYEALRKYEMDKEDEQKKRSEMTDENDVIA